MKFNKQQLDALIALPDDALWAEIVKMAKNYGFTMPEKTPEHSELEKLRNTARGANVNVTEALKMLNEYRKKG